MNLHEMLIDEEYVKGMYTAIGNNPRIPISHGFPHINAVLSYTKTLADIFNVSDKDKETLFCAVVLHDIAQVFLQKNHAQNSSTMAIQLLENNESISPDFIKSQIDINRVKSIISSHGGKTPADFIDPLSRILILADKLDFTKTRIRPRAKEFHEFDFMNLVESINLKLENNTLIVKILTNTSTTFEDLNNNHGLDNFLHKLTLFAEHENIKYKIVVNKI